MSAQIEDVYPLSPMQEGMLFHSISDPDSGAYFQQFTFAVAGDLDADRFTAAWQRVLDRHSALRSVFLWEDLDAPLQVVQRGVALPLRRLDWSDRDPEAQRAALEDLLQAERRDPFDLARAPLLRATLIRLSPTLHQFVWCNHHLLLDGWSVSQMLAEALTLYEGMCAGREPQLPPARPYRDYIAWLLQQDSTEAERFWRQTLRGFANPTPLAIGQAGAGAAGAPHAEARTILPIAATDALHAFARQHKLTLNTLVQGAWALLLGRYSGERDVVFGAPISSRPADLPGSERMVGLFINTIPVRVRLPEEQRVAPWLAALQQQQSAAQQYHHAPLAHVQSWSELSRGTALFESLLVFENYPAGAWLARPDATVALRDVRFVEQTNYPITLEAVLVPELVLQVYYDTARFEHAAIERMLGHLAALVQQIAARPYARLAELDILTPEERRLILADWNATGAEFPAREPIHRLFEQQVARTPEAVAVIDGTRELPYRELDRRANQLAHALRARGVRAGVHVGICVERSLEMVIGLLGILKAGGTYVPLDPNYPRDRIAFMLEDTAAPVLVTQRRLLDELPGGAAHTLCLDRDWAEIAREPDSNPGSFVPVETPAYLIYTSGSTGRPKGVAINHASAATFIHWSHAVFPREELAGVLASTSLCFDLSIFELFVPLSCGGTVIVAENALHLPTLPAAGRVTLINTVPSAMAQLAQGELPASLRVVNLAGEPLKRALVDRVYAHAQVQKVYNLYGPSEDTTYSTFALVGRDEAGPPTIGRPIAQTGAYVLDARLRPVPVGVAGELYLSGEGLALGYHNRPDLTAERFIPNPFGVGGAGGWGLGAGGAELKTHNSRLYRTGDLVRYRADGVLEHLGRIDHQVKIRGFRIELGEIEAALLRHPAIEAAVVVAREDGPGDKRLVAYVEPRQEPGGEAGGLRLEAGENSELKTQNSKLRTYLEERLPAYMVPAVFVFMDALPLTPNGKIDRKALPAPDQQPEARAGFVAPRTPAEQTLAAIWGQVLGHEQVGIHDNFFELGGDSIISIQIVARAAQAGLHITPKQVFQHRTVAELAAAAGAAPATQAPQGLVTGDLPLTPIQRWFFAQQLPNPHHYNQSVVLELRRPLAPDTLRRAFEQLLLHHDALRLRFAPSESGWRQTVGEDTRVELRQIDLAACDPAELPARIADEGARLQASLDITSGPLVGAALFDCGPGRPGRLLIAIHHLAVDGVSWRILLPDLVALYEQQAGGEPPKLPAKTSSYQQWAQQQAAVAASPALDAERAFWRRLAETPVAALPLDLPDGRTANTEATAARVTVELDTDETTALLQTLPKAYRARIDELLLAAVLWATGRWTGQPRLLIDLEGHGRGDGAGELDLSRTVGWFTALYPLLLERAPSDDLLATLRAIKEQLRAAPEGGAGYGILRYLGEGLDATPKAEICFNYLGQLGQDMPADAPIGFAAERGGPDHDPRSPRPHLLEVGGSIAGSRLRVDWTYSTAAHLPATVERLAADFAAALRSLIAGARLAEANAYTPSDFPLATVGQASLAALVGRYGPVDDLYPLTPVQQGMLFHALYEPESPVYHTQFSWTFHGALDADAFRRAWDTVVQRHAILRTAFVWEGLREPLQVVLPEVALPWMDEDWRDIPADEQRTRLEARLEEARRGFDMARAPLMRVALLRTADDAHAFVWDQHHILLDGWCTGVLLREAFLCYEALCSGTDAALPPARPYRDYIAWLRSQDMAAAEGYWRELLRGFTAPTPLPLQGPAYAAPHAAGTAYDKRERRLPAALSEGAKTLARQRQITLNTLLQGAWALLLAHHSGERDVVFGCTVAGRPPELPGVESMVGLFINTLPVRVAVDPAQACGAWLEGIQRGQVELRQYEYTPLASAQRWSELPPRQPLFETNVVFENIPTADADRRRSRIQIGDVRSYIQNNFPLTLRGVPEEELALHLLYSTQRYSQAAADHLLGQLETLLGAIVARPDTPLAELLAPLAQADAAYREQQARADGALSLERLKTARRKAIRG
ncbi:MAG TPA: amino acid adenylation domain-containing protein [Roseiflexaceae bacterium]|nr:amino acid adenylation domain-containing protein [Roseiflexaceae bacterium]